MLALQSNRKVQRQVLFRRVELHHQPVQAREDVPVDVAEVIAGLIAAKIVELQAAAPPRGAALSRGSPRNAFLATHSSPSSLRRNSPSKTSAAESGPASASVTVGASLHHRGLAEQLVYQILRADSLRLAFEIEQHAVAQGGRATASMSSKLTLRRPAKSAKAFAARIRLCTPRGLAPWRT